MSGSRRRDAPAEAEAAAAPCRRYQAILLLGSPTGPPPPGPSTWLTIEDLPATLETSEGRGRQVEVAPGTHLRYDRYEWHWQDGPGLGIQTYRFRVLDGSLAGQDISMTTPFGEPIERSCRVAPADPGWTRPYPADRRWQVAGCHAWETPDGARVGLASGAELGDYRREWCWADETGTFVRHRFTVLDGPLAGTHVLLDLDDRLPLPDWLHDASAMTAAGRG